MKRLLLLFFAVSFIAISSVKAQAPKTALEMNDLLVSVNDSLFIYGKQWGEIFADSYDSKNFEKLKPKRVAMLSYIERRKKELKNLKDIAGSEEFRKLMIEFLDFETTLITSTFMALEKVDKNTTEEALQAAIKKITDGSEKENEFLNKVRIVQTAYAAKNGFSIEEE